MREKIVQPPSILPLTLEHVKDTLRINTDVEDARLNALIQAATSWVEGLTSRALIEQTRSVITHISQEKLDRLQRQHHRLRIKLPTLPLIAIEAVTWNGLPLDNFDVEGASTLVFPQAPPPGELAVLYRTGYGTDRDSTPLALQQAILMAVVRFYEDMTFPQETEVRSLLSPFCYPTLH